MRRCVFLFSEVFFQFEEEKISECYKKLAGTYIMDSFPSVTLTFMIVRNGILSQDSSMLFSLWRIGWLVCHNFVCYFNVTVIRWRYSSRFLRDSQFHSLLVDGEDDYFCTPFCSVGIGGSRQFHCGCSRGVGHHLHCEPTVRCGC